MDFIGNKSHGEVSKNDINLFKQNYEEHCKTKNPSLIKSIELAKKLYQEKTSIDFPLHNKEEDDDEETKGKDLEDNLLGKKRKELKGDGDNEGNIDNKKEGKIRKNDIKINININVTNNNQRTFNINSFSSNMKNARDDDDKKNKTRKNKNENKKKNKSKNRKNDDEEYIFEEEEEESEESDDEDNEDDFDEESIENELLSIQKPNYKRYNNKKLKKTNNNNNNNKDVEQRKRKKKKLIKGNDHNSNKNDYMKEDKDKKSHKSNEINEDSDLDMDSDMSKDTKNDEDLDKIIHNLVNYQIQTSNNQNQKMILKELNKLQNLLNNNTNNANSINIYSNYNELYKILLTFTYNKNSDIVLKSAEILSDLPNAIINDVFILSKEEEKNILNDCPEKYNNNTEEEHINNELQKICDCISNDNNIGIEDKDTISNKSKNIKTKKNRNTIKDNNINESFLSYDSNNSNSISINNSFNNNFSDNIINIIINDLSDKFYKISENFFKNLYNKNDIGLDKNLAKKRKFVCIKLFSLFKKVFPKLDEEYIKKIILFFEYKIRSDDPTLGQNYSKEIDELFHKVKNINTQK